MKDTTFEIITTERGGVDWGLIRQGMKEQAKQDDAQVDDEIYESVIGAFEAATGVKGIPS